MRTEVAVLSVLMTMLVAGLPTPSLGQTDRPLLVDQITWVNPPDRLPLNVTHATFWSRSMDVDVGYSIYLPPGYEDNARRYPVVYWLHGRTGSERFIEPVGALHSGIEDGRFEPMVLVIANGGVANGYIDNPTTGVMGESVIISELMPHIEATYRVGSKTAGRGIGGYSMGGAGAVRMALRNPKAFRAAVSVGGPLFDYVKIMKRHWVTDTPLARKHDPYIQVRRLVERSLETPGLQMLIGTGDVTLGRNRQFRAHLDDLDVPYGYTELAGVQHNLEEYLDALGPELFDFFSAQLSVPIA